MHHFTVFFLNLLHHAGYGGLFVVMTLANIGAPIGSEVVLPAAGAMVAKGLLSSIWLAIAVAVLAELAGQSIGYAIGRFGGRPFVDRYGKYVRFHHAELERVEKFFARYGKFAIFICRFIPVIRGIVGIPAGIAEMPLGAFYFWTFCGSLIFCGGLILTGNALGTHSHEVIAAVQKYALLIIALAVVAVVIFLFVQSRRGRVQRKPS
ncbi:MAG TPA: DedA family protein [Candidatus Baltobacteraceae bacterium]|nr:DedA family protein [Candidatus Baltobacteraceae bacterium]